MSDDLSLRFERTYPAEVSAVWSALTDPRELAVWWGPRGFTNTIDEWDLRLGGVYRITMQPSGGEAFHLGGEFRQVAPNARLAFTFVWEEPDPDDIPAVVTISLDDHGGSTAMTVEHGPFKNEDRMAPPTGGWSEGLEKLGALLAPAP